MKAANLTILFLLLLFTLQQTIPQKLVDQNFEGEYSSKLNQNLFSYLDVSKGTIQIFFINENNHTNLMEPAVNQLQIQLYNPKYHDGKSVLAILDLPTFNQSGSGGWTLEDTKIQIQKYDKQNFIRKYHCNATFQIKIRTSDETNNPKNMRVHLSLISNQTSPQCAFSLQSQLQFYDDKLTIILYCAFVSVTVCLQLGFSYRMIKNNSHGHLLPSKISLTTITLCTIQDFYLAMTHVYFIMLRDYYMYFILPIFLLVLQSMFFDMKLVFVVWRASNITAAMTTAELRKRLTMFYVKFYMTLFVYLTVMYFFHFETWSIILQSSLIFLPQIIKNVRKGNNPHFYKSYILGVLGLRMVLVLYYKGCPQNIYMMTPSLSFCIFWVLSFVTFITFIYLQHKLGSRFFIPKRCLPGYFNYSFVYISPTSTNEEVPDCSICLQPVTLDVEEEAQEPSMVINSSINESLVSKSKPVQIMRTPCLHMFHKACLKEWIDMKMQCPTCRSPIPPIY